MVEGNIGSGKTTFLDNFTDQKDDIEIFAEPVDKWRNLDGNLVANFSIHGYLLMTFHFDRSQFT